MQPTFRPWLLTVVGVLLMTCVGSGLYLVLWSGAKVAVEDGVAEEAAVLDAPAEAAPASEPAVSESGASAGEESPSSEEESEVSSAPSSAAGGSERRPSTSPRPARASNTRMALPQKTPSSPTMMATSSPRTPPATTESEPVTMETPTPTDETMGEYVGRVRFVVRRYYAARAQSCFDHASRNAPDVRGRVVVRITIGQSGQVSSASVKSNSTGNDALGRCILGRVSSWRLPEPPGGDALSIDMPFSR